MKEKTPQIQTENKEDSYKKDLQYLYDDYLKAEKQRLGEEITLELELKNGADENRKGEITKELEILKKEKILNENTRAEILEKINKPSILDPEFLIKLRQEITEMEARSKENLIENQEKAA